MGNSNIEEGVRGGGDCKVKCAVISAKLLFSKQANVITNDTKRNCLLNENSYQGSKVDLISHFYQYLGDPSASPVKHFQ